MIVAKVEHQEEVLPHWKVAATCFGDFSSPDHPHPLYVAVVSTVLSACFGTDPPALRAAPLL